MINRTEKSVSVTFFLQLISFFSQIIFVVLFSKNSTNGWHSEELFSTCDHTSLNVLRTTTYVSHKPCITQVAYSHTTLNMANMVSRGCKLIGGPLKKKKTDKSTYTINFFFFLTNTFNHTINSQDQRSLCMQSTDDPGFLRTKTISHIMPRNYQ